MKNLRDAIVESYLEQVTFQALAQEISSLTTDQKATFVSHCIKGDAALSNFLRGICLKIARQNAQTEIDAITAAGTLSLADLQKYLNCMVG